MKAYVICTLLLASLCLAAGYQNNRPVIGIMTTSSDIDGFQRGNYSYIAPSYVDYIEAAGARVVPIPYDASPENLTFLLNQVNGLLLTGGGADLNYTDPVTGEIKPTNVTAVGGSLIKKVIEANLNGENVPIMATCQGWEILLFSLSENYNILLSNYSDVNVQGNVDFVPFADESLSWGSLPDYLKEVAQKKDAFLYDHFNAITPEAFLSSPGITKYLNITTLSKPINGGPIFVSSAEGGEIPIYGNQFHPEKNIFVWKKGVNPPHTADSIAISQYFANIFVDEARQNSRKFESQRVLNQSLIYNWNLTYVSPRSHTFDYVYFFPTVSQSPESYPNLFA